MVAPPSGPPSSGLRDGGGANLIRSLTAGGTTLLAGTADGGVFRSTDGGVTWAVDTTQPTDPSIVSLTASGTALFAGTARAGVWRYPLR